MEVGFMGAARISSLMILDLQLQYWKSLPNPERQSVFYFLPGNMKLKQTATFLLVPLVLVVRTFKT